jgi:hypothetical protein
MQFANYNAFRTGVIRLLLGDDDEESANIDTIDLIIGLGESRVYRDLRSSAMEVPFTSVTVTSNLAPIPSDMIEASLVYFTGKKPAEYIPEVYALELINSGATLGYEQYFFQQGENLSFWPTVANATTVQGRYFKRFADLKTGGLNAVFTRYPEIFLFAALAESAPFYGENENLPIWENKTAALIASANKNERWRSASAGGLRIRTR